VTRSAVVRKLAAIVIADVVGFSRHMERDDAGTLARLKAIREHLIDPKVAALGGHVVKTAGDGMLVEFGSADAALRCAIDVQRAMRTDNRSKAQDERIEFRIGINLGDIIVDGNDIAGDGVNVAARLEAMAEPGGICVSATVREQVHGGLDVGFNDIGLRQVKNIMRPIRVFAVDLDASAAPGDGTVTSSRTGPLASTGSRQSPLTKHAAIALAASAVVLTVAGASLLWWNSQSVALSSPPAMSVAVVPLRATIGDLAMAQRAESLTREVASMLSRANPAIRVVSVPSP
jgi:adenylate cyclase